MTPSVVLPVVAVLAAVLVEAFPRAGAALEFDRGAVLSGQWWRLLSCNLAHWGWRHWAGDMAAFAALWWAGRDRPWWMLAVTVISGAAVGVAVYAWAGDIAVYRGMSGVNYALLGWVLLVSAGQGGRLARTCWACLLAAVIVKVAYEVAIEGALPGIGLPEGVTVVGAAHAAGLIVGMAAALPVWRLRRCTRRLARPTRQA